MQVNSKIKHKIKKVSHCKLDSLPYVMLRNAVMHFKQKRM